MVVFAYSQTNTVIGTLTNGMKVVSSLVTVSDANFGTATVLTIKPLQKVVKFIACAQLNGAPLGIMTWAAGANLLNTIEGTPVASANGDTFRIISFGY
jgi:hypothetical protein